MHSANSSGPDPPALVTSEPELVTPPLVAVLNPVVVPALALGPAPVAAV
jgi:hypothetical protein